MSEYAVLMAVGEDKPGLVDIVSRYILECGCNIEDSRMAILGGEFAMLILVTGAGHAVEQLFAGEQEVARRSGLSIQVKRTKSPGEAAKKEALPYEVEAFSMDHPGIVQRIAAYLAERRINIRALDTRLTNAPITGLPLFSLHALVEIPTEQNVGEIRLGLETLAGQQNIDIHMRPAK